MPLLRTQLDKITDERARVLDALDSGQPVDPNVLSGLDVAAAQANGEFTKGLRRFGYSTSATTKAFAGQMLEPFAPTVGRRLVDDAYRDIQEMPQDMRPQYDNFEQAKQDGLRGVMGWAQSALGEGLPSTALMLAGGLAGRGIGSLSGRAGLGQAIGGIGSMIPLEGGETALDLRGDPTAMANTTPAQRAAMVLGRGGVNAALENVVPQMLVAPRLMGKAVRIGPGFGNALRNTALIAGEGALGEYGTEFAQDLTGQFAQNVAHPGMGYDLGQANEAGLQGAVVGGLTGGVGGAAQGVYSNLGAATDAVKRTAGKLADKFPSISLDNIIETLRTASTDPEAFGQQVSGMTLDGIDKLIDSSTDARQLVGRMLDKTGTVVGSVKGKLDEYVAKNIKDPALRDWYIDQTTRIGSMTREQLRDFTDALQESSSERFKEGLGAAARTTGENLLEGAQNFFGWVGDFLKGAASPKRSDEGKKSLDQGGFDAKQREDVLQRLSALHPSLDKLVKSLPIRGRRTIADAMLAFEQNPSLLKEAPAEALKDWERWTNTQLPAVFKQLIDGARDVQVEALTDDYVGQFLMRYKIAPSYKQALRKIANTPEEDLSSSDMQLLSKLNVTEHVKSLNDVQKAQLLYRQLTGTIDAPLQRAEARNPVGSTTLNWDGLSTQQAAREDDGSDPTADPDDAIVETRPPTEQFDPKTGNLITMPKEYFIQGQRMSEARMPGSPFNEDLIRQSLADQRFVGDPNHEGTWIPIHLSAEDIPSTQLAKAFGYKYGVYNRAAKKQEEPRYEPLQNVQDDKPITVYISPQSLVAMARSAPNRGRFVGAIPQYGEFEGSENQRRGSTFLNGIAELTASGISVNPETLGLPAGEPIHVNVDIDPEDLHEKLVLSQQKGGAKYTLGDFNREGKKKNYYLPATPEKLKARRDALENIEGGEGAYSQLREFAEYGYRQGAERSEISGAWAVLRRTESKVAKQLEELGETDDSKAREIEAELLDHEVNQYKIQLPDDIFERESRRELSALREAYKGGDFSRSEIENLAEAYATGESNDDATRILDDLGFEPVEDGDRHEEHAQRIVEMLEAVDEDRESSDDIALGRGEENIDRDAEEFAVFKQTLMAKVNRESGLGQKADIPTGEQVDEWLSEIRRRMEAGTPFSVRGANGTYGEFASAEEAQQWIESYRATLPAKPAGYKVEVGRNVPGSQFKSLQVNAYVLNTVTGEVAQSPFSNVPTVVVVRGGEKATIEELRQNISKLETRDSALTILDVRPVFREFAPDSSQELSKKRVTSLEGLNRFAEMLAEQATKFGKKKLTINARKAKRDFYKAMFTEVRGVLNQQMQLPLRQPASAAEALREEMAKPGPDYRPAGRTVDDFGNLVPADGSGASFMTDYGYTTNRSEVEGRAFDRAQYQARGRNNPQARPPIGAENIRDNVELARASKKNAPSGAVGFAGPQRPVVQKTAEPTAQQRRRQAVAGERQARSKQADAQAKARRATAPEPVEVPDAFTLVGDTVLSRGQYAAKLIGEAKTFERLQEWHDRIQASDKLTDAIKERLGVKVENRRRDLKKAGVRAKPTTQATTTEAPKEQTMSMVYADGGVYGGVKHNMRPEFKGKSTIALIQEGKRTATSRKFKPTVSPGQVIQFTGARGESVSVRVTTAPYKVNTISAEQWSKLEGWSPELYDKYREAWQFRYELLNKPAAGAKVEKTVESRAEDAEALSRFGKKSVDNPKSKLSTPKTRLLKQIKRLGGIKSSLALDLVGEKAFVANRRLPGLFTSAGMDLDELVETLQADDWFHPDDLSDVDGGVQKLRDMIQAEFRDEAVFKQGEEEKAAEAERDRQAEEEEEKEQEKQGSGLPKEIEDQIKALAERFVKAAAKITELSNNIPQGEKEKSEAFDKILAYVEEANDAFAQLQKIANEQNSAELKAELAKFEPAIKSFKSLVPATERAAAAGRRLRKQLDAQKKQTEKPAAPAEQKADSAPKPAEPKVETVTPTPEQKAEDPAADKPRPTSDEIKAIREKFRKEVEKMLGKKIEVSFENLGDRQTAGMYQTREQALASLRKERRVLVEKTKQNIEEGQASKNKKLQERIKRLEEREKAIDENTAILGLMRIAAGREQQAGLREHETFHAAFHVFFTFEERRILTTAFTRGLVATRLREYFKDQPEVLKAIEKDAEEAAAYGFQLWMTDPDKLQLGEKSKTLFGRFMKFIRGLFGILSNEEKAKLILEDLASGQRAETEASPVAKVLDKDRSVSERAQEMARDIGGMLKSGYDFFLGTTYNRLKDTDNPILADIARRGYQPTGAGGEAGVIQKSRVNYTGYMNRLSGVFKGLTEAEAKQLHEAGISAKPPSDAKLAERYKQLRKFLDDFFDYQKEKGVDIGKRENYYPMLFSPEKVLKNKAEFLAMLAKYEDQMAKSKATPLNIWENISGYIERGEDFVNMMGKNNEPIAASSRARVLAFITPEDRRPFMEDNPIAMLERYVRQGVRQAEYVDAYGVNGSKLKTMIDEARDVYGATPDQIGLAHDYVDAILGNREAGMSRELKDVYGAINVYQNYRLLPLSLFPSLVDPLGIAVRSNSVGDAWETFTYSLKNLFRGLKDNYTKDQWEMITEDWGIIAQSGTTMNIDNMFDGVTLRGVSKKLNEGLFKWNLLNGWVRNNTIMAVKSAQRFFYRVSQDKFGEERSARYMEEVGLTKDDVIYNEKLGRILMRAEELEAAGKSKEQAAAIERKLRAATEQFVRQALLNPSAAEKPNWMNNPYLAPIAHLKAFVFSFDATILDRVMHEVKHENYKPAMVLAAYVPSMIAVTFLKDMVSGFGEEPPYKEGWGFVDYLKDGIDRAGLTGTGQFFTAAREDVIRGGGGYEGFAGPSIGQLQKGAKAFTSGSDTQIWNFMVKSMPFAPVHDQFLMSNGAN